MNILQPIMTNLFLLQSDKRSVCSRPTQHALDAGDLYATTGYIIVTSHHGVPRELSRSALLPYGFLSAFEEYTVLTRLFLSPKQDVPILPWCTGRL